MATVWDSKGDMGMSALVMRSFRGLFTVALAGCVSAVLAGCAAESGDKVADGPAKGASQTNAKPAETTTMAKLTPAERVSKKPAPKQPVVEKAPSEASAAKNTPVPVVKKAQQPAPAPNRSSVEDRRQATTDALYAQIRVEMEKAILQRKALLDGGRAPSDVEIRNLEGKILKARSLLMEVGEEVEDVDPPILTQPKQ